MPKLLRVHIVDSYFALILFGQVFFSSLANLLSVDNRFVMLLLRLSIMIFSYGYIYLYIREKRIRDCFNVWIFSVLLFWCLYLLRLFYDVYVSEVALALPVWELLAWSLGSSLPIAICCYIMALQQKLDFALIRQVKYGVFLIGISIICFLVDPGLDQGRFYLEHLNAITCANAGCTLMMLCLIKVMFNKARLIQVNSTPIASYLGILFGLFVIIYSATRGVFLASLLMICASVFLLRSRLEFKGLMKSKYALQLVIPFSILILLIGTSPHLLEKVFTPRSANTILSRLEFWKISIEQFVANPFMGIGFRLQEILGSLEIEKGVYYPHNYVFESLAIGGISMTLPLLYCMFSPLANFFKEIKNNPTTLPSGLMAAQALIYSMHNGHLGDFPFFWMAIGILAGSKYRIKAG
ncbi:O-antigen ligase family protein [Synechococcus sp. MU1643]|uniref:O-antigen ligase family protein n=1 Tax=Synechococcus sp. MU1643 TaxID=2508349 RepID=UPI001CF8C46B|nr:O-antigen ligase family protein [Synechococcus sp. MU1643]MCB4429077.1 O-antigen ligase family protein [Synechococcus sp. MU1643]